MDRQTILLISDMRQVCLAEILTKKGHNVRCLDIRNRETALQQLEKLKRFLDKADVLILPIPVQKVPEQEIFYDILNKNLEKKTLVMGGCFSTEQRELLTGRDIHFLDFMEDTVVTEENAVATAEGTIAELVEKSPYNIDEAKVLVTGYGYCGKAIAKRLGALGARVTVLARRKEARKEAKGYYTMFCDENMEGYDEILMWKQFKEGLVTSNLQMELARNGGGSGWTRGMVNSFLMRNGLPIYAAGSDYNPDWEKEGVNSTLQNRDSRIVIFTKKPGDANTENKGDVNYYGDDGTPSYCSIRFIYGDKGSLATTGFIIKKGKHYSSHMANDHSAGTSGGIVFRAAEAMLIYMEASYEKNGRIDGTADGYWKALRRRAKVDEDYNKTIAATQMSEEAKGDFGAYSHGQLIDATLYNIRRERRNELCAEALRWEDLKRWRACDQLISKPYRVEGMLYWGSNYETQLADLCKVDPAEGNMSSPDLSKYILPYEKITKNNLIAGQKGFLFTPAHYLSPIGMAVFRQTASDKNDFTSSVVYQNPGWKIEGDTGAQPVE